MMAKLAYIFAISRQKQNFFPTATITWQKQTATAESSTMRRKRPAVSGPCERAISVSGVVHGINLQHIGLRQGLELACDRRASPAAFQGQFAEFGLCGFSAYELGDACGHACRAAKGLHGRKTETFFRPAAE